MSEEEINNLLESEGFSKKPAEEQQQQPEEEDSNLRPMEDEISTPEPELADRDEHEDL